MLFSSVFAITERRDVGLYEVPWYVSLLGFGIGTMLANFHMGGIMLVLREIFNMLVRDASPRWPMCFRCLMFILSRHCDCYFYFAFFCILDLRCGECYILVFYVLLCLSCMLRV